MPLSPSPGRAAAPVGKPPRVWRRQTVKLTRMRERTGDLSSRTLYFTFPGGRSGSRSHVTFVSPEHVLDFAGEEGWFEMALTEGVPWSCWRAVRQVEPPQTPPVAPRDREAP